MPTTRALLTICLLLSACNSSSFKGSNAKQPAAKKPVATPPVSSDTTPATPTSDGESVTETFSIVKNQGLLDVVWVVDNSGSMAEEAAQVRKNFAQFAATVDSRSDVRIALLSQKVGSENALGDSTGVDLPSALKAAGGRQVDAWVGSTDPMALLAAATCKAESTDLADPGFDGTITLRDGGSTTKICGKSLPIDLFELEFAATAPGKLHDFYRPQAKKVFVFVTDDDAEGVDAANFLDLVRDDLGGQDPTIFGFIGLDESRAGCKISKVGAAYRDLAEKTGGGVFDICDSDWSANFGKLSADVASIAAANFTMKSPKVSAVVSATADGKSLPSSAITVSGATVSIDPAAMPAGATTLTIVYKR